MARASVCDVSGVTLHSCTVTRTVQNVHDQPESIHTRATQPAVENKICPRSNSRPFRSLKFLTPGTRDIIQAVSSSPEFFWPFFFFCLINFCSNFDLGPSNSKGKKPTRSEIMILECSFHRGLNSSPVFVPTMAHLAHFETQRW